MLPHEFVLLAIASVGATYDPTLRSVSRALGRRMDRVSPDLVSCYNRGFVALETVEHPDGKIMVYNLTETGRERVRLCLRELGKAV